MNISTPLKLLQKYTVAFFTIAICGASFNLKFKPSHCSPVWLDDTNWKLIFKTPSPIKTRLLALLNVD